MQKTTALDRYGVRGRLPAEVWEVLALADEFRAAYCALQHRRYVRTVDLRNQLLPNLLPALERRERAYWRIAQLERDIKATHAKQRDRNRVTVRQRAALKEARAERKTAQAAAREQLRQWTSLLSVYHAWWQSLEDWKNVKSLSKRRDAYAAIDWPRRLTPYRNAWQAREAERASRRADYEPRPFPALPTGAAEALAQYGQLDIELDLAERELSAEYQARGLHSTIRGEIVEASQPKRSRTAPGIRYVYHRAPELKPWTKVSLQFVGGLSLDEALDGTPAFGLAHDRRDLYWVRQQIGTAAEPRMVQYRVRFHRRLPTDTRLQRWTLVARREAMVVRNREGITRVVERERAHVTPIARTAERDKPQGDGVFAYRLGWRVTRDGLQVARFWGDHVHERLVLPHRLIAQRLCVGEAQAEWDERANALLAERGAKPRPNRRQGVAALADYVAQHPDDRAANNMSEDAEVALDFARRRAKRAERTIEKIYQTVAYRIASRHRRVVHDPIDLAKLARYDTRDLLAQDALPKRPRELRFAAALSKLRHWLRAYGLEEASGEECPEPAGDARETDLVTSYVASQGHTRRHKRQRRDRRSQTASEGATM